MTRVFIDGSAGTTGLRIMERFSKRPDIELISIDEAHRKDPVARAERMNSADIVFLCLPDAAARESVTLIENPKVRVLDTSTAHRTAPGWCYGFPELSVTHREQIHTGKARCGAWMPRERICGCDVSAAAKWCAFPPIFPPAAFR